MELLSRNYVKYGLIMTAVLVVCLALMEITGNNETFDNKSPIFLFYQFLSPLIVWWLGIKSYKKELGGKITFKQGVSEGFRMSLVFALASPFVFLIYYTLVNPEIIAYVKDAYQMPNASTSLVIAMDMFIQLVAGIIGGTIYALIPAFFLKSKS